MDCIMRPPCNGETTSPDVKSVECVSFACMEMVLAHSLEAGAASGNKRTGGVLGTVIFETSTLTSLRATSSFQLALGQVSTSPGGCLFTRQCAMAPFKLLGASLTTISADSARSISQQSVCSDCQLMRLNSPADCYGATFVATSNQASILFKPFPKSTSIVLAASLLLHATGWRSGEDNLQFGCRRSRCVLRECVIVRTAESFSIVVPMWPKSKMNG